MEPPTHAFDVYVECGHCEGTVFVAARVPLAELDQVTARALDAHAPRCRVQNPPEPDPPMLPPAPVDSG